MLKQSGENDRKKKEAWVYNMLKQSGENDRIKKKKKRRRRKWMGGYIQHAKTKWPKRQTSKTGRRGCTLC